MKVFRWLLVVIAVIAGATVMYFSSVHSSAGAIIFERIIVDSSGPRSPWGKTTGDLNGDGLPDLIVGGNESKELVWYVAPDWVKSRIAAGASFTTDHVVADIDRDGRNDVVSLTGENVIWYRNPAWQPAVIDTIRLHDIEAADLDGDGDIDLAGRDQSAFGGNAETVYLYRQDTPGKWQRFDLKVPNGEGLRVVDLNSDGRSDIVVNGMWFQNPGAISGDWKGHVFTRSWTWPHAYIATGDINDDGRIDIAMSPAEPEGQRYRVSWFEAPPDRGREWVEHVVEADVETVRHFIGIGDMDNDGRVDIISAQMHQGHDPDDVIVYRNAGAGANWHKNGVSTAGSHSMQLTDIDRDGDIDMFGANWSGDDQDVLLWRNRSCDTGQEHWRRHVIDADRPWRAIFIAAADLNGDGRTDIISGAWWYENPGPAGAPWVRHTVGAPAHNMALVADLDGDGATDILATQGKDADANARFAFARNNGQGNFSVLADVAVAEGDFLQGAVFGRFGGNIQVALSWHKPGYGVQMLTVPADISAQPWPWTRIHTASQDEQLSAGDIDGDGDTDLLLGTQWLRNDGTAWALQAINPSITAAPDRNRLADIDGDGKLDAVVGFEAISRLGKVAWYRQSAQVASTWAEQMVAEVTGPMSMDVADMDHDGDLDIIVGEHNLDAPKRARLLVMENVDGKGSRWTQHVVYTGDEHHDGAVVADIDRDGDNDIVSIGWGHNKVLWYENRVPRCAKPLNTSK